MLFRSGGAKSADWDRHSPPRVNGVEEEKGLQRETAGPRRTGRRRRHAYKKTARVVIADKNTAVAPVSQRKGNPRENVKIEQNTCFKPHAYSLSTFIRCCSCSLLLIQKTADRGPYSNIRCMTGSVTSTASTMRTYIGGRQA